MGHDEGERSPARRPSIVLGTALSALSISPPSVVSLPVPSVSLFPCSFAPLTLNSHPWLFLLGGGCLLGICLLFALDNRTHSGAHTSCSHFTFRLSGLLHPMTAISGSHYITMTAKMARTPTGRKSDPPIPTEQELIAFKHGVAGQ